MLQQSWSLVYTCIYLLYFDMVCLLQYEYFSKARFWLLSNVQSLEMITFIISLWYMFIVKFVSSMTYSVLSKQHLRKKGSDSKVLCGKENQFENNTSTLKSFIITILTNFTVQRGHQCVAFIHNKCRGANRISQLNQWLTMWPPLR